jgi:hypothetical protein
VLPPGTATRRRRVHICGAADDFTFDHTGEVALQEPTEIVVEVMGAAVRRLRIRPRLNGHLFPGVGLPGTSEPDTIPPDEPRARREVAAGGRMWASFDYDDGVHPFRDIADGQAMVRFFPDMIEVVVFDDQAARPTSPDAPLAP